MNLIESIKVVDGVNPDTVIPVNYYSGQDSEINVKLALIPTLRGEGSYSIIDNIPTFNWSGIGNNKLWVLVDGIWLASDALATITIAPDTSIIKGTVSGSITLNVTLYENKKLIHVNQSTIEQVMFNDSLAFDFFYIHNSTGNEIGLTSMTPAPPGGVPSLSIVGLIKPNDLIVCFKISGVYYFDVVNKYAFSLNNSIGDIIIDSDIIDYYKSKSIFYMSSSSNVTINKWVDGVELYIVNKNTPGVSGNITVHLPPGQTTLGGYSDFILSIGTHCIAIKNGNKWLIKIETYI